MGLFDKLGAFAEKVWSVVSGRDRPVAAAQEIADLGGISVEPADLADEWGDWLRGEAIEPDIVATEDEFYIERDFYQYAPVAFNRPFAYTVKIEGIDLETGEWTSEDRWLTFSRPVMVSEIKALAEERFGEDGEYAAFSIDSMSVTHAWLREGEGY
jgi:hypothetical protein